MHSNTNVLICFTPHPPLPLKGGGLACLPVGRGEGEALQNKAYLIIEYRVYPIYTLSSKG